MSSEIVISCESANTIDSSTPSRSLHTPGGCRNSSTPFAGRTSWVFKRGKARKYLIADSAFKRLQVDAPGACWLDANEHHLGLALRTGGALNCSEGNDGREALRLGHDASLEQAGAQHSLSPVMPR
ncbi:MAG: hypothetical protein ACJ8EL_08270, partial [Rhizomicrobium sp.]